MADIKVVIEALDHCIRAKDCRKCKYLNRCKYLDVDSLELLKSQQAEIDRLKAEQQKVIRCKDCKNRNSWECWQYFFGRNNLPDDYFCADGKPKDGEQDGT